MDERKKEMNQEMANAAAKWWADKLRNGCHFDNGDSSETGAVSMLLGLMLADTLAEKRTPEQVDAFEVALAQSIAQLDVWQECMGFGVDYHPDRILSDAANAAGIVVDGALPWKTHMNFMDGKATVREGYGALPQVIFDETK
jgi:hypothetical protein